MKNDLTVASVGPSRQAVRVPVSAEYAVRRPWWEVLSKRQVGCK